VFVTILVVIAAVVMIRLGLWQLDRLEQRRAFNTQVLSQINELPLPFTDDLISGDLESLEFRTVQVQGIYDLDDTLVLGNQVWEDQIGVHLLTPLNIAGTDAFILVDRGWIPFEDWENRDLSGYQESGSVSIQGMLRATQTRLGLRDCLDETVAAPPFQVWCLALEDIASKLSVDLLPVYLIQEPQVGQSIPPYRAIPKIEISEGPHLSYAIQWFTFSGILLIGYPFFVRREIHARERKANQESDTNINLEYHGWAEHLDEDQET
jgi:surfeit locus 1 family protein